VAEWVVREGVGAGGMTQALYAHMNNKRKIKLANILLSPRHCSKNFVGIAIPFSNKSIR
jgi:hypothetical protein